MLYVSLSQLRPNSKVSKLFPIDENYQLLKMSVELDGILEPLVVIPQGEVYIIVSGVRRFKVAQELEITEVPVIISDLASEEEITEEIILSHQINRKKSLSEELREVKFIKDRYNIKRGRKSKNDKKSQEGQAQIRLLKEKIGKTKYDRLVHLQKLIDQYTATDEGRGKEKEVQDRLNKTNNLAGTIKWVQNEIDKGVNKQHPYTKLKVMEGEKYKTYVKSSDKLSELSDGSVQVVITSPPYPFSIRDYGLGEDQLGSEKTLEKYVSNLSDHLEDVYRVLNPKGSFFLNIGDFLNPNTGVREFVALSVSQELQRRGWIIADIIIWIKNNPHADGYTKRTQNNYEYIIQLVKSPHYFYDISWIRKEGSSLPNCMTFGNGTEPFKLNGAMDFRPPVLRTNTPNNSYLRTICAEEGIKMNHSATFPKEIPYSLIRCASQPGDVVLDVFAGTGTTGQAAIETGRKYIGYELFPEYAAISKVRLDDVERVKRELVDKGQDITNKAA